MNLKQALPVALALVLTLVTGALAGLAFAGGQTLTGVLLGIACLGAAYAAVLELRRRERARQSEAVLGDWPPERVRAALGRIDGEVARVRALRKAEPALTLTDAAALVRAAEPGA